MMQARNTLFNKNGKVPNQHFFQINWKPVILTEYLGEIPDNHESPTENQYPHIAGLEYEGCKYKIHIFRTQETTVEIYLW